VGDDLTSAAGPRLAPDPLDVAWDLAEREPQQALALLDSLAEASEADGDPTTEARVRWARGRALRGLGRRREAVAELEAAAGILHGVSAELWARVAVVLALDRMDEARFEEALELLEAATHHLEGGEVARALAQKALVLQRADRSGDALAVWDRLVEDFGRAGMPVEKAAAQANRGLVRLYRNELGGAEADLRSALAVFRAQGQDIRATDTIHNLGLVAGRRGDLPRAFELIDEAQAAAARLGAYRPQALVDRVQLALDAGLVAEARHLSETAVARLEEGRFDADVPEACLLAARACHLDGDPAAAMDWAQRAEAGFETQGRSRWALLAQLATLRAAAGDAAIPSGFTAITPSGTARDASGLPWELRRLGHRLRRAGWADQAIEAETIAARWLIERGQLEQARPLLRRLRRSARPAPIRNRLEIRLLQARAATAGGDLSGAIRAVAAAAQVRRAYQAGMGSLELRSRAGGQDEDVVGTAVLLARAAGDASPALWCSETVRTPPRRAGAAPARPDLSLLLGELRHLDRRLSGLPPGSAEVVRGRRRQAALEELVRRHTRHHPGSGNRSRPQGRVRVNIDALTAGFAGLPMIEFVSDRQDLHALLVHHGSVRLVRLAGLAEARKAVAGLRLALHIAVTANPPTRSHLAALERAGRAAESLLLAPLDLGRPARAVIVPDPSLSSCPWPLLPSLANTALSVAPSGTWWLEQTARACPLGERPNVLLVEGPGLNHAGEELDAIAGVWPSVVRIGGPAATVAAVEEAARDADVIHIAAHASHRGDHPLLSGIRLWDGHLTGYELAIQVWPAKLVVLSCCETGMAETADGIGLSRLVTEHSGATTALASVSPLADRSAGALMVDLHRRLAAGVGPARALAASRRSLGGAALYPSAAGFVCFGA
jgi:tetratricopeptide (TPR) repeat protein